MNAVIEEVRQPYPEYVVQLMNAVMEEIMHPTNASILQPIQKTG